MPVIESAAGTFTYAIACGSGTSAVQASTQVTVAGPPPTTLSASAATAAVDTPVTLTWNSATSDVCTATGGSGSDGWTGTLNYSGSMQVTSLSAGTITYGINCNSGTAQTQVNYMPPNGTLPNGAAPSVQLSSSATTEVVGQSVTLTWASQHASSCAASGGAAGDGWTGSLPLTGAMHVAETVAGSTTYEIVCTGATPAAQAQVTIDFTSASGSGSGGGGGAIDEVSLILLSLMLLRNTHHRRRTGGPTFLRHWRLRGSPGLPYCSARPPCRTTAAICSTIRAMRYLPPTRRRWGI
jgi:hypothetical protein